MVEEGEGRVSLSAPVTGFRLLLRVMKDASVCATGFPLALARVRESMGAECASRGCRDGPSATLMRSPLFARGQSGLLRGKRPRNMLQYI